MIEFNRPGCTLCARGFVVVESVFWDSEKYRAVTTDRSSSRKCSNSGASTRCSRKPCSKRRTARGSVLTRGRRLRTASREFTTCVNLADFIAAATGSPESRSSLGENDLNMEHEVQPTVVPDDVVETDSVQVQSAEETDDRSQNAEGNDLDAETDDRSQSAEGNDLDAETDDRSQSAEGNNLDAESEAQPNTITITDNVVLPPAPDSVEMLSGEDSSECSEGNDFDVESDALPLSSTMIDVPNCIQIFLEEVMEFTFSVHRGKSSISDGDVSWLLHLTNRTLHLSDIDISFTQNVVYDHINFNMCKYHLSRILLSASESGSEEKLEYGLSVCPIQVINTLNI